MKIYMPTSPLRGTMIGICIEIIVPQDFQIFFFKNPDLCERVYFGSKKLSLKAIHALLFQRYEMCASLWRLWGTPKEGSQRYRITT